MSKIYEALRQAEADREKNPSNPSEPGVKRSSVSQALLEVEPTPVLSDRAPYASVEPRSEMEREFAGAAAGAAVGDGLRQPGLAPIADLGTVTQYPWHPALDRLPALEERGNSVEQFRSLRSRMQEFRDLNKLKSILVSSGLPQEGKSFVAANLAISFARHKAGRVLLIDGDMRRATLHELLGAPQGPGLTEYLAGEATLHEILQRPETAVADKPLPHGLATLTFIPAGNEHDKAADLSGNHRFEQLITAVEPHFDWIVVDSSPVNLVSDGVNLARGCDAVLLVARGGVTKYETAQRALAELKASKVVGVVLNAVKDPVIAGGYYGYDGYDKIES